jgi:hypothetical protein
MPEAFYLKKLQVIIQGVLQKSAHVWIFMLILHEGLGLKIEIMMCLLI